MVLTSPLPPLHIIAGLRINHPLCRVEPQLNCIKGGGACHLREKVLAEAAETCVYHVC